MAVNETDPAGEYNIVIRQGDTFTRAIALTSNGVPLNLTNSSSTFAIAQTFGSSVLTLTTGDGISTGNAAGTLTVTATAQQTEALAAGVYNYEFSVTAGSAITTYLVGSFTVLESI